MSNSPPEYCDFDCPWAAFPPAETSGICRTMAAVWCRKLKDLVGKNRPCEWRRRGLERKAGVKHRKRNQR